MSKRCDICGFGLSGLNNGLHDHLCPRSPIYPYRKAWAKLEQERDEALRMRDEWYTQYQEQSDENENEVERLRAAILAVDALFKANTHWEHRVEHHRLNIAAHKAVRDVLSANS
ncbi:unnamed protein product [marine sediment metagenome]|uniref:Uncharacterized protein n=1 Tax=marine sediment metagenome TaxID=412755 RepID=X0ZK74_9ZZZZ